MSKRKVTGFFIIFAIIFFAFIIYLSQVRYQSHLVLGGKNFIVEVADTNFLLEKGLSGHIPLYDNGGMLFIFKTPEKYGFWMKDMNFPIDIIWIDKDSKIVYIEKFVLPSTYPKVFYPETDSLYVLEINAGHSEDLGLKIGDNVKFLKKWF